ncbi:hypothetical protein GCM10010129_69480 [Streptomyces fumigatiscleroticus]|nr:hypothetical protein GCM10010129_69480 [Streptomyces fumigatiscleroticus]
MSRAGAAWTDMDSPVAAADPVIWSTSRFCTVSCIHVPAFDTKFATDHQRMLRCLRDRHGEVEASFGGAAAVSGTEPGRAGEEDTVGTRRREDESGTRQGEATGARNTGCAARPLRKAGGTASTMVAEGTAESVPDHAGTPLVKASTGRVARVVAVNSVVDHSPGRPDAGRWAAVTAATAAADVRA